jgi:hypothetical protein
VKLSARYPNHVAESLHVAEPIIPYHQLLRHVYVHKVSQVRLLIRHRGLRAREAIIALTHLKIPPGKCKATRQESRRELERRNAGGAHPLALSFIRLETNVVCDNIRSPQKLLNDGPKTFPSASQYYRYHSRILKRLTNLERAGSGWYQAP